MDVFHSLYSSLEFRGVTELGDNSLKVHHYHLYHFILNAFSFTIYTKILF